MQHLARLLRHSAVILLAASLCAGSAHADTTALQLYGGALDNTFTGTLGWEFTVNSTITVTQLDLFDDGTSLLADHSLAVFDPSGQVYALGTVGSTSTQSGLFSDAPVTSSFPLTPGNYIIGAFLSGGDDYAFDDGLTPIDVTTPSEISFLEDRYHDSSLDSTPTLAFPESTDQDPTDPFQTDSYFGPDFQFVDGSEPINSTGPLPGLPGSGTGGSPTVPEPAPATLLVAGLLVLPAWTHRRSRREPTRR
jgi:hypothetical protein